MSFAPFKFDNSFARELPEFYQSWQAARVPDPAMVCLNLALAEELGMDMSLSRDQRLASFFAGMLKAEGSQPLAMVYAGHQFGGFSPRLGDGRALLLGEVIDSHGRRRDLHLKGSGKTHFSRGGDGKAVLGPVLREYLMGEAMYVLGIPTTRALAAVVTGEAVYRDGLKPGAVLARVAASHIRVGTFEYFAARGEYPLVAKLVDYSLARHYPELSKAKVPALALLEAVSCSQAELVARWMGVGFVHGVMNTDNVAISGETLDYGPCAFMERYDSTTVFSTIDSEGRYAYANQPGIARWNLARFAEALLPLLDVDSQQAQALAQQVLDDFAGHYTRAWLSVFGRKFGLASSKDGDLELFMDFMHLLGIYKLDFTQAFRALIDSLVPSQESADNLLVVAASALAEHTGELEDWLGRWRHRLSGEDSKLVRERMLAANPLYIPRNQLLQSALDAAEGGDMSLFEQLLDIVSQPFSEQQVPDYYRQPAPADAAPFRTYCGT